MGFVIIPHRGQSCKAPENTYAAFDLALQQGFLAFETDCQLSSCGVPVIIHDEELSRIAGVSHRVGSLTLPELLQLDVGSWFGESSFVGERIPLLSDLLNRYGETCHIHLVRILAQTLPYFPLEPWNSFYLFSLQFFMVSSMRRCILYRTGTQVEARKPAIGCCKNSPRIWMPRSWRAIPRERSIFLTWAYHYIFPPQPTCCL